jgi:hypothetical protein
MPKIRTPSIDDGSIQFTLRLPPDVSKWIRKQAENDSRSTNAEIVHFLRQAMNSKSNTVASSANASKPDDPQESTMNAAGSVTDATFTNDLGIAATGDPTDTKNSL